MRPEICDCCGRAKKMYYRIFCPVCEKPEIKLEPTLNFLECLYHLEAIGYEGIKDRVWKYCCDHNIMKSNDSYMNFSFYQDEDETEEQFNIDKQIIKREFSIKEDSIIFWVSW